MKIHTVRLVGIILSLFAKRPISSAVRNVEASYTRTGFKGYWVNKKKLIILSFFKYLIYIDFI